MTFLEVFIALAMGIAMYRLMVSKIWWLSTLGYLLGLLFVALMSMQIGMNLKACAPVAQTWYM